MFQDAIEKHMILQGFMMITDRDRGMITSAGKL